jgi:hypothetical protein
VRHPAEVSKSASAILLQISVTLQYRDPPGAVTHERLSDRSLTVAVLLHAPDPESLPMVQDRARSFR